MSGPWDKYAQQPPAAQGPWNKYAQVGAQDSSADQSAKYVSDPGNLNIGQGTIDMLKQRPDWVRNYIANPLITSGREAQSAWDTMKGMAGGIYHAAVDPEQPGETTPLNPMASAPVNRFINRMFVKPAGEAADWYGQAATGKVPNPTEQALSVAPEAMGTAAGNVVGGKMAESTVGAVKNLPGDIKTAMDVSKVATDEGAAFREGIKSVAHDRLTQGSVAAKKVLWDARNKVSERVGALKNDTVAADFAKQSADGQPGIALTDLLPKMDELAVAYKAAGGKLPYFDAASNAIAQRTAPLVSFEEAANLRSEIGDLWNKAPKGTRDSAALFELREALTDKLQARATELGQQTKFKAYNDLWRTLQTYEQQGAFGDMMSKSGKDFFDVLRDPANGGDLARTFNSLEKFGLKSGFKQQLVKQYGSVHDYLNADTGSFGKVRAIMRHPLVAGAGAVAGMAKGGFVGSTIGAVSGAELADTIEGIRAIRDTGGVPARVGEMNEAAKVQPSGATPQRPPAPTVDINELTDIAKSQGYDKTTARARAMAAARAFPNDQKAAIDATIKGVPANQ